MGLTAIELTAMRVEAALYLPDTCNIWTVTQTVDSIGGLSGSGTAIRANIPCRYAAGAAGWEEIVGFKPQVGVNAGMFSLNGTMTLNLTDIIVFGTTKYYIKGLNVNDSERMLTRAAVETANG